MVGPSHSETEYAEKVTHLKLAMVAVVGASGATIAFANGAPLAVVVAATVAATLFGALLVWYLGRIVPRPD
jgi:membrane protein YqaA with SNARE-associated domain